MTSVLTTDGQFHMHRGFQFCTNFIKTTRIHNLYIGSPSCRIWIDLTWLQWDYSEFVLVQWTIGRGFKGLGHPWRLQVFSFCTICFLYRFLAFYLSKRIFLSLLRGNYHCTVYAQIVRNGFQYSLRMSTENSKYFYCMFVQANLTPLEKMPNMQK